MYALALLPPLACRECSGFIRVDGFGALGLRAWGGLGLAENLTSREAS